MPPDHRLEELGEQAACLNCGAPRSEIFCQRCGQRHVTGRLSAFAVLRELPRQLFSLERGLLFTILRLWRSPGLVAREYVHGKRKRYAHPMAIFLIAASMQILTLSVIAPQVKASITEGFQSQGQSLEQLEELLGENPDEKLGTLWINTMKQGYTYIAFLFFCIPLAVLLSILRRGDDFPYLLGEHCVFAAYTVSQLLICTALANLVTPHINTAVQFSVSMLLYFGYLVVAHRSFFAPGVVSLIKTLMAFVLAVFTFFVSLCALFVVMLAIHVVSNR